MHYFFLTHSVFGERVAITVSWTKSLPWYPLVEGREVICPRSHGWQVAEAAPELWVVAGQDLDGCQEALSEKSLGNESLARSLQQETHRTHFVSSLQVHRGNKSLKCT